jgi:hypothetical protein
MNISEVSFLKWVLKEIPQLRYALAVAGLVGVVSAIVKQTLGFYEAIYGTLLLLGFMFLFVIFCVFVEEMKNGNQPSESRLREIIKWFCALLFMTACILALLFLWNALSNSAKPDVNSEIHTMTNSDIDKSILQAGKQYSIISDKKYELLNQVFFTLYQKPVRIKTCDDEDRIISEGNSCRKGTVYTHNVTETFISFTENGTSSQRSIRFEQGAEYISNNKRSHVINLLERPKEGENSFKIKYTLGNV